MARKYSKVHNYKEVNFTAAREIHRQVGDLEMDDAGIARHVLLVRHQVLPNQTVGINTIMKFLVVEISPHSHINIMDQHYPCYQAGEYPTLNQTLTRGEYEIARVQALNSGLYRLDGNKSLR